MKSWILFAAVHAVLGAAWAQDPSVVGTVRFDLQVCGGYWVDGQFYDKSTTFVWPKYTYHTLAYQSNSFLISTDIACQFPAGAYAGTTGAPVSTTILVTEDLETHSLIGELYYRLGLVLGSAASADPSQWPADLQCPSSGILINGACYDHGSVVGWYTYGTKIQVQLLPPPPGWVFTGWVGDLHWYGNGPGVSFMMDGPKVIRPSFATGTRIDLATDPPNMKYLVDGTVLSDVSTFWWLPGSTHYLSPVEPQYGQRGETWLYKAWSDGGAKNRTLIVPNPPASAAMGKPFGVELTLLYSSGARTSIGTYPYGLKLVIDGTSNWPTYNFLWTQGSEHTISAPARQTMNGRAYVFDHWSDGAAADRTYTTPPTGTPGSPIAYYNILGQLNVLSSPSRLTLVVDGQPCTTPCTVDKPAGATVAFSAPPLFQVDAGTRIQFVGWADGGSAARTWTAGNGAQSFLANYQTAYKVNVYTDPDGAADFAFAPPLVDGYAAANTPLAITALPRNGYKFKYWDGDFDKPLETSLTLSPAGMVNLRAVMEKVPFLGVDAVRNGAGVTPEPNVAPGSVISIVGENLAPQYQMGDSSPLNQVIGGVSVESEGRLLPLFYVSAERIDAQLFSDFTEGEHTLTVHQGDQPDVTAKFTVKRNAPGLFTRPVTQDGVTKQYALALHDDGNPVTTDNPAAQGETITLLGTGFGPYARQPIDGFILPLVPKTTVYPLLDTAELRNGGDPATDTAPATPLLVLQPDSVQAAKGYIGTVAVRLTIGAGLPSGQSLEIRAAVKDPSDPDGKTYHESNRVLLPLK